MGAINSASELDVLFTEVASYRYSAGYRQLLNFIRKFRFLSPYNAALVYIQRPGSGFVATVGKWAEMGRTIKPGSRPLMILVPFGPVSFVYEVSDTEGEPLPQEVIEPFRVTGAPVSQSQLDFYLNNIRSYGVRSVYIDGGTGLAGSIERHPRWSTVQQKTDKWMYEIKSHYTLVLNRPSGMQVPCAQLLATAFHEMGHLLCGHLGAFPDVPWKDRSFVENEAIQEFEAESVCWLVCERLGIKNPSAEYLSGYYQQAQEIPPVSVDTILRAAGMIESDFCNPRRPVDKLIIGKRRL